MQKVYSFQKWYAVDGKKDGCINIMNGEAVLLKNVKRKAGREAVCKHNMVVTEYRKATKKEKA